MEKVYTFDYCDCIYESAFYTVSLHRTKKGAEIAMEFHKAEKLKEFNDLYDKPTQNEYDFKFGQMEAWRVSEMNIQE